MPLGGLYAQEVDGRAIADKALNDIKRNIAISDERAAVLAHEVEQLKKDQHTLSEALVKSAKAERDMGFEIRDIEGRLKVLFVKKLDVEKSLTLRRGEFGEVLAALERMGLKPPPAILVHPDDALQSVRSAVLLGSVVPEMQERMEALSTALRELKQVEQSVQNEQEQLVATVQKQTEEKQRLELLLAEKAKLQKKSEESLVSERKHNEELAQKAASLQDLLAELERQSKVQTGSGVINDSTEMLVIGGNFAKMRGRLARPAMGSRVQTYSKTSHGEVYETQSGAIITAPVEGVVRFAGSFRSYGQLLIIDVGQGYHLILAGMGKIDVGQGQMVLEGEPVGSMGTQLVASATAFDIGKSTPMLYIEIRKDGKPVDPAPWWARR